MALKLPEYEVVIIDPASTEFNRGSFCYLPYLVYSHLRENGTKAKLLEDFTVAQIDTLPDSILYWVAVWSYPQIEAALILEKFLPVKPAFFGYTPLLKHLGLSYLEFDDEFIEKAIGCYHKYYDEFKTILLSDCDMHLKKYEGQVYPLFTSYGCPKGCSFCPATINCNHNRVALPAETVINILWDCYNREIYNIHFTDEDFFFDTDRAAQILKESPQGQRYIALGSVNKALQFMQKFPGLLKRSGVKIIEVGLETADEELAKKMGKPPFGECIKLAGAALMEGVDIFWLTLTFHPGETVSTLNRTGRFLRDHGFDPADLYGRIRTNGTEGGLGQFFQPYHGTKGYDKIEDEGQVLSYRPVRLSPSFVPFSFLGCKIKQNPGTMERGNYWFDLYRVRALEIQDGKTIYEHVQHYAKEWLIPFRDSAVFFAICARLGIIEEV